MAKASGYTIEKVYNELEHAMFLYSEFLRALDDKEIQLAKQMLEDYHDAMREILKEIRNLCERYPEDKKLMKFKSELLGFCTIISEESDHQPNPDQITKELLGIINLLKHLIFLRKSTVTSGKADLPFKDYRQMREDYKRRL